MAAAETGKNAVENNNFDVSGFGQGVIDSASQVKAAVDCYNRQECSQEDVDRAIQDASVQKVPYDPGDNYVFLWSMTGTTLGSVILVPEGWLGAVLGGAWFGGNASAIEQKVTTGKIDLDELALSAGVGGLTGGVGKGIIELGGKGINYLTGGYKTGTVWDFIKATQPAYEGTSIPKSFNIKVDGVELWVAPNGTKHMWEYVVSDSKNIGTFTASVNSQMALKEFESALNSAIKQNGVVTDKMIYGGDWEFILSAPREAGQNVVVKHARYNPKLKE